jgi:hypothetical protein
LASHSKKSGSRCTWATDPRLTLPSSVIRLPLLSLHQLTFDRFQLCCRLRLQFFGVRR